MKIRMRRQLDHRLIEIYNRLLTGEVHLDLLRDEDGSFESLRSCERYRRFCACERAGVDERDGSRTTRLLNSKD